MAKFSIAMNPTFKVDVEIPRVGAAPVKVPFVFKVIGRKELGKIYDKWGEISTSMKGQLDDGEITSYEDLAGSDIELQVQQIKDITVGWGFEDKFDDESIYALCDTCVDAASAIVEAFQKGYSDNRSKN